MLFRIPQVLNPEELDSIRKTLDQAEFIDGQLTAGWHAKTVKNNEQLKTEGTIAQTLQNQVKTALLRHPLFQVAVRPRVVHTVLFSRYEVGMSYGRHTDNAMMGGAAFHRSDVSFTLFLNEPQDYEGGALVIEAADDEAHYRLEAGTAILYPSSTLHQVEPVTQGRRLVAVGWVQSLVRDPAKREILFDLETARRSLFSQSGKTNEFDLISKSVSNLLRQWMD